MSECNTEYEYESLDPLIERYNLRESWRHHPELLHDCQLVFDTSRKNPDWGLNRIVIFLYEELEMLKRLGREWYMPVDGYRHQKKISIENINHFYTWAHQIERRTLSQSTTAP